MVWKLREGKVPPKEWMADLLFYLEQAHKVMPTRELVESLYSIFVEQWRDGATVREVGKATCSCQKGQIVPSPAARVQLQRGVLKPPRTAKRGDLFGFDELRARRESERAGAAATAAPKREAKAVPSARASRTAKKGTTVNRKSVSTTTAPPSAAPPDKTEIAASPTPPKPDAARLKATEAKLRSFARDLEGDDL